MALENLSGNDKFIDALVTTNPDGSVDAKAQGDDHIRGIKNVLKNCFAAITGAVTATHTEMNSLAGVKSVIVSFLTSAGATDAEVRTAARAAIQAEQADAAILKSDEPENLVVGYTTDIEDLGTVSSGTIILDLSTESIKKITVQGDFTLQAPASGNGYCEIKIVNSGTGPHTITLNGITVLSGTRNTANGGVDFWRISRIDGSTYAEIVNIS